MIVVLLLLIVAANAQLESTQYKALQSLLTGNLFFFFFNFFC